MVVVMKERATEGQIDAVIARLIEMGMDVHRSSGATRTVLGVVGAHKVEKELIELLDGVHEVLRRLDGKTAMRMHRALRTTGGAGRIDDHQRVVGGCSLRVSFGNLPRDELVPGPVASGLQRDLQANPRQHDDVPDRRAVRAGLVGNRLHRDWLSTTPESIGGKDDARVRIAQTRGHGVCTVSREKRKDQCANLDRREEGDDQLRAHDRSPRAGRPILSPLVRLDKPACS